MFIYLFLIHRLSRYGQKTDGGDSVMIGYETNVIITNLVWLVPYKVALIDSQW